MSQEIGVAWKIKVRRAELEIEVVGKYPDQTKEWFDELAKKHLK